MTRTKAFQTAAARRRVNPITWVIDDVTIRLKPSADLIAVADLLDGLQKDISEDESQIRAASERREMMLDLIQYFVDERDSEAFAGLKPDLDLNMCVELVTDLLMEYTGQENPTQQRSSLDGSQMTGQPLMDGAQPGMSMPQA